MDRPDANSLSIDQLDHIEMSSLQRSNACDDLRKAQAFVDLLFAAHSRGSALAALTARVMNGFARRRRLARLVADGRRKQHAVART